MKVLFIGGTGNISAATSRYALDRGIDLYHLNRGNHPEVVPRAMSLVCDIHDAAEASQLLKSHTWDVVVDWIAFDEDDVRRAHRLFGGKTGQYIFISSASCYQKPLEYYLITEHTPVENPFSQYATNKIACERYLLSHYAKTGFPVTIVRPSHTYDTFIPVAIGGGREYTTAQRILDGKEIIVHGDGTSLWTVTHADDFAPGLVGLMGNEKAVGEIFHITSGEILTWNQIYTILGDALGEDPKMVHIASDFICDVEPGFSDTLLGDKSWSVAFDNSKIKSFVPEFKPCIPFRDGIKSTLSWFDADPERKQVNPETDARIERVLMQYRQLSTV